MPSQLYASTVQPRLNGKRYKWHRFFGVNTKECYRYYSAIKLRKNPSRTYFIDKMQVKLNEKIRRDEELERMRR